MASSRLPSLMMRTSILALLLFLLQPHRLFGCEFVDNVKPGDEPPCIPKSKVTALLHTFLRSVTTSSTPSETRDGFTSKAIQAANNNDKQTSMAYFRAASFYKPGEPQTLSNLALILRDTAVTLVNKSKKQRKIAWRMLCEAVASYELIFYLKNKPINGNGQMKDTYSLVSQKTRGYSNSFLQPY
jgi:hypothetical protein